MAEDASANSALLEKAKAIFDSLDTDGMGDSRAKALMQANSQTLNFLSSETGFLFASAGTLSKSELGAGLVANEEVKTLLGVESAEEAMKKLDVDGDDDITWTVCRISASCDITASRIPSDMHSSILSRSSSKPFSKCMAALCQRRSPLRHRRSPLRRHQSLQPPQSHPPRSLLRPRRTLLPRSLHQQSRLRQQKSLLPLSRLHLRRLLLSLLPSNVAPLPVLPRGSSGHQSAAVCGCAEHGTAEPCGLQACSLMSRWAREPLASEAAAAERFGTWELDFSTLLQKDINQE